MVIIVHSELRLTFFQHLLATLTVVVGTSRLSLTSGDIAKFIREMVMITHLQTTPIR